MIFLCHSLKLWVIDAMASRTNKIAVIRFFVYARKLPKIINRFRELKKNFINQLAFCNRRQHNVYELEKGEKGSI